MICIQLKDLSTSTDRNTAIYCVFGSLVRSKHFGVSSKKIYHRIIKNTVIRGQSKDKE